MNNFQDLISSVDINENKFIEKSESIGPVLFNLSSQRLPHSFHDSLKSFYKNKLKDKFKEIYEGKIVNPTERKPVAHFEYRKPLEKRRDKFLNQQKSMFEKSNKIKEKINGPIIFFGIGGSQLAPSFLYESLMIELKEKVIFITGSDPDEFRDKLDDINLAESLFIVASKSFSTIETLDAYKRTTNLDFLDKTYAITASPSEAKKFGIPKDNILEFDENTGGRFSIWSTINLLMPTLLDEESYASFLEGGNLVDEEILEKGPESIILTLSSQDIFYNNVLKSQTNLILNYDWRLRGFSKYAQQIEMESNGKSIDLQGNEIQHESNSTVWGGYGPESQHSFFQQVFQGTKKYNIYLISSTNNKEQLNFAQYLGLSKSLEDGTPENTENFRASSSKAFTKIELNEITPKSLGVLMAAWENKTILNSLFWNINAFDQWGVELGKQNTIKFYS